VAVTAEMIARYSGWITSIYPTAASGALLVATLLLFRVLSRVEDPQKFTQVYLVSIVAKILLACVLIVVLIFIDRPSARVNVLFLFAMYVVFTVIEVLFLVRARRAREGAKKI
jgi:formate hydrogenlyase subunit 4